MRPEGGRRMKNKRVRTIFTPEQLERMEDEFNKYLPQNIENAQLQNPLFALGPSTWSVMTESCWQRD